MSKTQSVDKLLSRARKATKDTDWIVAVKCFQSVLSRFPSNKRARQGLDALRPLVLPKMLVSAREAKGERRWADAEAFLNAALALSLEKVRVGLELGLCQMELRRAPAALQTAQAVLAAAPDNPEALNLMGRALNWMGRGAEAEACFETALAHQPTDAQTLNNLGILARARGDRPAAAAFYQRAIEIEPKITALHKNLSEEITYVKDAPHLEQMRTLLASSDPKDSDTAPLYFALFKALDDLGETADAFANLQAGNRLMKAELNFDFQKDAIPTALGKTLLKAPVGGGKTGKGPCPIFVTGMPRSGTTLVERILSRAKGAQPCGELTVVQLCVIQLLRHIMDRPHKALTQDDIAQLGRDISLGLSEYSDGSPYLIDKMPLNFRWIGFICDALPDARIVHISRDPMAVAWSVYRQSFDGAGNGFIYDPSDIARFMALHRDLMTHWRTCFPGRIIDVAYEELVSDPATVTRALAEATRLDWSPDWLTPEQATNQVLTASAGQVQNPIYRNSNDQWLRYESQLSPMVRALTDARLLPEK